MNNAQSTTHNTKQLGFSGLREFGSRFNFFQRWIGTQPENPTVSYCKALWVMDEVPNRKIILY